jgi:alpha,alpha-trehalase
MAILKFFIALIFIKMAYGAVKDPDSCDVFCRGPLLDAVQKAHIFPDSKHFVDMPMLYDPETTLTAFDQLSNKSDPSILREFVSKFFTEPGTELKGCHQADWVAEPKSFEKIHDPVYRQWAYSIHAKWRTLCRRVS